MSVAFVFPGQGSHRPGALDAWEGHPALAVLEAVDAGLGRAVAGPCSDPTTGSRTADAQPAILAASLVAWRAVVDAGILPAYVAGHSLGEYTAAIASGAIEVEQGAALVAARGAAMGAACAADPGTMAAVVKLHPDAVAVLVGAIEGLVIANDNAPGQIVVAGPPAAVAEVRERAREAGGRAVPLEVEGAFHSPAMAPAVATVAAALATTAIADPRVPVVSGTTAAPLHTADALRSALLEGILAPVRWRGVQERLAAEGVDTIVELGPGGVLAGLAKRTVPDLVVHSVAGPDDLASLRAALGAAR